MEPAQEQIVCTTQVRAVESVDDGKFRVTFYGITSGFWVAQTELQPGDRVRITITKEPVPDAQSS